MSDTGADGVGEQQGGAPDTTEYAAPISAVAPKVVHQEESQVEVSASPAFQCLDEVRTLLFQTEIWNFIEKECACKIPVQVKQTMQTTIIYFS